LTLGQILFKNRGYVPIPFIIVAVLFANPREDLMVFGGILMVCGELLRLLASSYLGISSRSSNIDTSKLVTNGPYAYVRNPIYFANLLLYMGGSILAGALLPYLLYLIFIFFTIFYALVVRYEESRLREAFENKYESFLNNVPRFFPRLSAYPNAGNTKPNFSDGLNAEKSTIANIIGFVALVLISWYIQS
jgi:protein-S-isoprenylcysteine O-methyltransferase Ste14